MTDPSTYSATDTHRLYHGCQVPYHKRGYPRRHLHSRRGWQRLYVALRLSTNVR